MKHINLTNWRGSITDWTKLNYIYGGLDDSYAVKGNLRIDKDNYNYVEFREGYNLFDITDVAENTLANGVTYKITNGELAFKGTNTASLANGITIVLNKNIPAGTYSLSLFNNAFDTTQDVRLRFMYSDNTNKDIYINATNYANNNIELTKEVVSIYIRLGSFSNNDWVIFKLMLVSGTTAPSIYEPNFEGKKYVITEKLGIINMGTLNWTLYANNTFLTSRSNITNISSSQVVPMYTAKYKTNNIDFGSINDKEISSVGGGNLYVAIRDTAYETGTALKTSLNGVMLTYKLKDPVIEVVE